MHVLRPVAAHLPSYKAALERGWGPDNLRPTESGREELARIAADPELFIASMHDPEAKGPSVTLKDGSQIPRLPGYRLWMWDGAFCGSLGFRWQPGSATLPPHVLGHVGYSVVEWKRRQGYATWALALFLPQARESGLSFIDLTADTDNLPSQKVITANNGILVGTYQKPVTQGGGEGLLFRIFLSSNELVPA